MRLWVSGGLDELESWYVIATSFLLAMTVGGFGSYDRSGESGVDSFGLALGSGRRSLVSRGRHRMTRLMSTTWL